MENKKIKFPVASVFLTLVSIINVVIFLNNMLIMNNSGIGLTVSFISKNLLEILLYGSLVILLYVRCFDNIMTWLFGSFVLYYLGFSIYNIISPLIQNQVFDFIINASLEVRMAYIMSWLPNLFLAVGFVFALVLNILKNLRRSIRFPWFISGIIVSFTIVLHIINLIINPSILNIVYILKYPLIIISFFCLCFWIAHPQSSKSIILKPESNNSF